ncbi:cephalosporin hydroxylase family protein [Novosphingopyxis sp.]|uniref:cephalosporin hydroxylase family protein n=1 Tax=Novosphingopyxis sp. TaxID=2709690 RepID=UPI003B5A8368
MKTVIDETRATVTVIDENGSEKSHPMESAAAFEAASKAWLRAGWDAKHVYSFTWMGRPIIQLPEDMVRLQELIWTEKPDVIIETGVAHGGSLIFYASLFEAMGHGRVIGIDIEIRAHNREAIEAHSMMKRIELVEGSSIAGDTVAKVKSLVEDGEKVMVILDSNHLHDHVLDELRAYAPLVGLGDYIVATDGIMQQVVGAPRSAPGWDKDNPQEAARNFVAENPDFEIEEPEWLFNEGLVRERVTYWPGCYVKRIR